MEVCKITAGCENFSLTMSFNIRISQFVLNLTTLQSQIQMIVSTVILEAITFIILPIKQTC